MLTLYTEEQLLRAYKVYIKEYCTPTTQPDLETFRIMFEDSLDIQELASESVLDN